MNSASVPGPSRPVKLKKTSEKQSRQWDHILLDFLNGAGLIQAARGLEADIIIMNEDFERETIPVAIGELMRELMQLGQPKQPPIPPEDRPFKERKLDYVKVLGDATPQSRSTVNQSISQFLAQNRARVSASNRAEFLRNLYHTKRKRGEEGDVDNGNNTSPLKTCARTDAIKVNRDVQMQYDIAKNDDGPLRRTVKVEDFLPTTSTTNGKGKDKEQARERDTIESNTGLLERFQNVETHLALRYVPSPPHSLYHRLNLIEEHIIRLEKDYPPWAALHFNQPKRGWPPPPRPTPIIVPTHLSSSSSIDPDLNLDQLSDSISPTSKKNSNKGVRAKSSLHRAVMDKLQVQKAKQDDGAWLEQWPS